MINELLQSISNLDDPFGKAIIQSIYLVFWVGVGNYAVHMLRIGYDYFCLRRVQDYIKDNHGLGDISFGLIDKLRTQKFIVQSYLVKSSHLPANS